MDIGSKFKNRGLITKFIFFLVVCLLLQSCLLLGISRLVIGRGLVTSLLRMGMMSNARTAIIATIGRASSLSMIRFTPEEFTQNIFVKNGNLKIYDEKNTLVGILAVAKNTVTLYAGPKQKALVIRSIRDKNIVRHYNFNGDELGKSVYKNKDKRIEYFNYRDKFVGYDVVNLSKKAITHYDQNSKILHISSYEKKNGNFIYKPFSKSNLLTLDLYVRSVSFNQEEVIKAYRKYITLTNQCYYKDNLSSCRKARYMRGNVNYLIRKYK